MTLLKSKCMPMSLGFKMKNTWKKNWPEGPEIFRPYGRLLMIWVIFRWAFFEIIWPIVPDFFSHYQEVSIMPDSMPDLDHNARFNARFRP